MDVSRPQSSRLRCTARSIQLDIGIDYLNMISCLILACVGIHYPRRSLGWFPVLIGYADYPYSDISVMNLNKYLHIVFQRSLKNAYAQTGKDVGTLTEVWVVIFDVARLGSNSTNQFKDKTSDSFTIKKCNFCK